MTNQTISRGPLKGLHLTDRFYLLRDIASDVAALIACSTTFLLVGFGLALISGH